MTRSIKDLRELVCVSRLTMREEDKDEDFLRPLTSLSLFEGQPADNTSSVSLENFRENAGEDRNNNNNAGPTCSAEFLPNAKSPLPPVRSNSRSPSGENPGLKLQCKDFVDERQGFYDDVLQYVRDDSTSDWLKKANQQVYDLTEWCQCGENFVDFCHFWLTEFALSKQVSLLKLEIGIILEEVGFSLREAILENKLREADVKALFVSLFPEYPQRLCSPRGQYIFLNILDTLSSGRNEQYKRLLTDLRIFTLNSDLAQTALAMRAYIVMSIWSNIVHFYRKTRDQAPCAESPKVQNGERNHVFQAVRRGRVRALHYLLRNSFGSPSAKDGEGRSLAFLAVLYNQPRVLKYLVAKHSDKMSLTEPCHSGNTCVHVAANLNHTECLHLLLESGQVDINHPNHQCDGATPLHLAVMQGNQESVEILLRAGANRELSMNGVTPLQLADELGHEDVQSLLLLQ